MCYPSKPSSLETLIEKINLTLIGQVFDFLVSPEEKG